jgi:hypothetical protein
MRERERKKHNVVILHIGMLLLFEETRRLQSLINVNYLNRYPTAEEEEKKIKYYFFTYQTTIQESKCPGRHVLFVLLSI